MFVFFLETDAVASAEIIIVQFIRQAVLRIMKKGFTEVPSTTYARNFIIKVRESGIPFVQEYKQALLESGLQSAKEWLQGNI